MSGIGERLKAIYADLPTHVGLVAVSKFHPAEDILEAYNAGQRIFGESRVQELVAKRPLLPDDIEWHFIGTLQTNKVKQIAPFITTIQSADSLRLIEEINRQASINQRIINILIEVHIAKEQSKHGFGTDECETLFKDGMFLRYSNLRVCGLMGMATFTDNEAQINHEFSTISKLFQTIRASRYVDPTVFNQLSTGMSDDYHIAIAHGSTMVRIGTKIFGNR
ncbi:MAG: YggS family pyridoxal phosphate-dependent enzyme [Tannerella sp.]|jgi:pyridoxal phosphate enzyme (YggS family)|nr:YggS family pyridoxal phosphate-dependent enzyme [Tannerella sp.]